MLVDIVRCWLLAFAAVAVTAELEEPYSLLHPYQPTDNNKWETGAGAKVYQDYIRLTPSQPSRTGYVWSRIPVTMTDWEVVLKFQIGSDDTVGGEGMAFWFVEKRMLGPIFGSADYWNGIGIMFDTYNNDNQGQSPLVMGIYNDGTRKYEAHNDGQNQAAGQCYAPDLRNRSKPSHLKIKYLNNQLTVEIALDMKSDGTPRFHPCFNIAINLGIDKFFGVTAATGHPINAPGLPQNADNHDIIEIRTTDLSKADTTEEDRQSRRDSYRKEVEEEHTYMPDHRDVTPTEFKHQTIALLNQISSGLQILELSQTTVDQQLHSVNNEQMNKETMETRKGQSDATAASKVQQSLEQLMKTLDRLVETAKNQNQNQKQDNTDTANQGISREQQDAWEMSYKQLNQEMKAMRSLVSRIRTDSGGRAALGGQSTVVTQVKEVVSSTLNRMSKKGQGAPFGMAIEAINDFLQSSNNLQDAVVNSRRIRESNQGGMTWTQFGLVLVLCAEMITILALQFKNGRDDKWSHKRV